MKGEIKAVSRKIPIRDYIICFLLALAISAAPCYIRDGVCRINLSFVLAALTEFAVLLAIFYAARAAIAACVCHSAEKLSGTDSIFLKKYSPVLVALIILACWIPVLTALYPGTVINDSWGQLKQYIRFSNGENALYDHHPVLVTLIMGKTIMTIQEITGNLQSALFVFVLLQAVLTSLVFSVSVIYAYRKLRIGKYAALCMLFLYCLLPVIPTSVQTISKDAFSAWLFVLFELLFIEGVRTGGEILNDIRYLLLITFLGLLCALTKKVNTYVVLLSLGGMFVFIPKKRGWLTIPAIVIFTVMLVIMPEVLKMNNIRFGGKQEMLSIPFQQTARYVKEHPDDITEEEYLIIDKLLNMSDLAERYNPINADPVKGYHERGTKETYIEYIKVWIAQGIRHPRCYIDAFNAMIAGWFSFSEYDPLMSMNWHNQLDTSLIAEENAERHGIFAKTAENYQSFYDSLYENSLLKFLFSYNTYAVIIPAFTVSTLFGDIKQRKRRLWIAVLPILFSLLLGCFLAPLSISFEGRRYLYPLTYTMPVMLALCTYVYKDRLNQSAEAKKAGDCEKRSKEEKIQRLTL